MNPNAFQDAVRQADALMEALPADDPRRVALIRLDASRRRIRGRWAPEQTQPSDVEDLAVSASRGWARGRFARRLRAWARHLHVEPAIRALSQELQKWWKRQSWAPIATVAVDEIRTVVKPSIRRHPAAWLGAGLLAGAALIWMKPWRHPWVRSRCAPVPDQVGRWFWAQCTQPAVYMALTGGLVSLLERLNQMAGQGSQGEQAAQGTETMPDEQGGLKG